MNISESIIDILKQQGIDLAILYPCAKIQRLYRLCQKSFRSVNVTKEEEGVGICAGVSLGGFKPAMLIQSTGLGNMINALCSLTLTFQLPLLILSSWRGVYREEIIAQVKLGESLPRILESVGIRYQIVNTKEDLSLLAKAAERTYNTSLPEVVLLSPQLFEDELDETSELELEGTTPEMIRGIDLLERQEGELTRFEVLETIAPYLDGKLVVCNIGLPSRELYHIKHQPSNFYMLGSLGLVSSIGLGVAMTTKQEVVIIDGDGSLLSNLGSLATIARVAPQNLTILAIDNGVHGSTGNQRTATSEFTDLAYVAQGLGIRHVYRARSQAELASTLPILGNGPNFVHILARAGNAQVPVIPLSPEEIKCGFMEQISRIKIN